MMFYNYNGKLFDESVNILHHNNRLSRYGDGVFESMAMFNGAVKLLPLHQERLMTGAQLLEIDFPETLNGAGFAAALKELDEANQLTNARIRVTLFRDSSGFYIPERSIGGFIIEADAIANNSFVWPTEGLKTTLFTTIQKPINQLSQVKTCNALLYVKAGLFSKKAGYDECIILNEKGEICESISSNIFWVKKGKVYTTSLASGCIAGVMRRNLIKVITAASLPVEEGEYGLEALLNADELFLSSATRGIRWVTSLQYNETLKTYHNEITRGLLDLINA